MVVKHKKKVRKQRGSRTHGWGLQHRGKGQKGGAGKGGIKAKQPQRGAWLSQQMGKHGFVKHGRKTIDTIINIRELEQHANQWLASKKAKEEAGAIVVDLKSLGFTKLLSTGKATRKWKIVVPKAVSEAVEKVKAAGGEVITK